jgi:hypothetical protein
MNAGLRGSCGLPGLLALALSALFLPVHAAAQGSSTGDAFWPKLALRYQWDSRLSQTVFAQLKDEDDIAYQQVGVGTDLGYQVKRLPSHHLIDIDPSKQHAYNFATGYQYLTTLKSGVQSYENRLKAAATIRHRPVPALLLEDRNQFEFRWVEGAYSSRYRNRVMAQGNLTYKSLSFSPYLSAEFFYSWAKDAWNEQRYSVGIQWPFRGSWRIDTYYLLKACTTCDPEDLNVFGLGFTKFLKPRGKTAGKSGSAAGTAPGK